MSKKWVVHYCDEYGKWREARYDNYEDADRLVDRFVRREDESNGCINYYWQISEVDEDENQRQ